MIKNILLKNIRPNPFQTRHGEDPDHIQSLAMSIKEHGMLQIPSARIDPSALRQAQGPDSEIIVQLAFGHSRNSAYEVLFHTADNPQDWESMPLNIVELTDIEMFEQAVAENRERKDLSPIEEAQAMVVYKDHFKKTSEQIGELFHLSDSAVRNKMRLLDLPDDIQTGFKENKLSESVGRELLTYFDLPAEVKNGDPNGPFYQRTPRDIVGEAMKGATAETLHEEISELVNRTGQRMDEKLWKHTDEFQGEKIVGICKGCAFLLKRDKEYCLKKECFNAKMAAFKQQYLEKASLLSGIPALEDKEDGYSYNYGISFEYGKEVKLKKIRSSRCENLRLKYDPYASKRINVDDRESITHLVAEGFPQAEIICSKRNGFCTCLKAMEAGVRLNASEDGAALAQEDLKEINRQVRAQKKHNASVIQSLIVQSAVIILDGINANARGIWVELYENINSYLETNKEDRELIEGGASIEDIKYMIARKLSEKHSGWQDDPKTRLKHINENLKKLGLEELPISFEDDAPTPAFPVEPAGKTLAEVFSEQEEAALSKFSLVAGFSKELGTEQ